MLLDAHLHESATSTTPWIERHAHVSVQVFELAPDILDLLVPTQHAHNFIMILLCAYQYYVFIEPVNALLFILHES